MKKNTTTGVSKGKIVAIGAGVAALAAASYYFFGPQGKKNRATAKGWMIKMKGEIVDKMEDAKEVTQEVYDTIVDKVAAGYAKNAKAHPELALYVDTLKKQWKGIAKSFAPKKKVAKKTAPKKVAKKVGKK